MTEDQLYNLSDEELRTAVNDARNSPSTEIDEGNAEEYGDSEEEFVEESTGEEVDELEQPTEDSDYNGTDGDVDPEASENSNGEQTQGEVDTAQKLPVQRVKVKANGKEFEFTQDEILSQFPSVFGQAVDYTKKMQALKPWRKTIDAIENAKLGHDDVNLMIDVLKGDKNAVAEIIKRTGVDLLELDTENSGYTPNDYGRDDRALALKDVIDEISSDQEYAVTHQVLSKEWDDSSWTELSSRPQMIRALHVDVKNGVFDKVQPIAEKLKLYGRGAKSDLEYYLEAGRMYYQELEQAEQNQRIAQERATKDTERVQQVEAAKSKIKQVTATKQNDSARKAAAVSTSKAGPRKMTDYLDAHDDEQYHEWYKRLQESR